MPTTPKLGLQIEGPLATSLNAAGELDWTVNNNAKLLDDALILLQGLLAELPILGVGQGFYAKDVNILYVGTPNGNAPTTALPLIGLAKDVPINAPLGTLYYATDTKVMYICLDGNTRLLIPPMNQGTFAAMPALAVGAAYLTTDTNAVYIGTAAGNVLLGPSVGMPGPIGPQGIQGVPGPQNVFIVTVTLTAAQLLALNTTPILIVPAPGAGNIIFPQSFMLEYLYGGTAYHTPLTTNNAFFGWVGQAINSIDSPIAFTGWGVFIETALSCLAFGPTGNAANVGINLANAENKGLQFGVPNALTLGNGTLKVTLVYSIIPA